MVWPSTGRSEASRRRARAAGLDDLGALAAVVAVSDVLLSVCPPGSATDVARLVAAARFGGLYVDANAVAPATARDVGEIVGAGGRRLRRRRHHRPAAPRVRRDPPLPGRPAGG